MRHVGDDGVAVKLRVEIAAGLVAEDAGDHVRGAEARLAAGCRIMDADLEIAFLDMVERRAHGRVMRRDHPPVAVEERRKRHRFRGGQRQVETGAMLVRAVALVAKADVGAGNIAFEKGAEGAGIDLAVADAGRPGGIGVVPRHGLGEGLGNGFGRSIGGGVGQAELGRPAPVPEAGLTMFRIVRRVIAVLLEIARGRRRRPQ